MDYKSKIIELINGISNTAKLEYLYYVIRSFLKRVGYCLPFLESDSIRCFMAFLSDSSKE